MEKITVVVLLVGVAVMGLVVAVGMERITAVKRVVVVVEVVERLAFHVAVVVIVVAMMFLVDYCDYYCNFYYGCDFDG